MHESYGPAFERGLNSVHGRPNLASVAGHMHPRKGPREQPLEQVWHPLFNRSHDRNTIIHREHLFITFTMEQSFCFVNGMQLDRVAKKQMRRHVMMGKNAGKTVHRRSKKELLRVQTAAVKRKKEGLECYEPISIHDNVLTGLSFPVDLTLQHAEIISNCKLKNASVGLAYADSLVL